MPAGVTELNFADYAQGTPRARESFSSALLHGLQRCGFIIVRDHPAGGALLEQAYRLSARFFAQEEGIKRRHMRGPRGYVPFRTEHARDQSAADLKEFWQTGPEPAGGQIPVNVWPDMPQNFKAAILALFDALQETGRTLLEALEPPLGLPSGFFAARLRERNSVLRLLHYPPLDSVTDGMRAAAHEDINLITLLPAPLGSGLELLDADGGWVAVQATPHDLIVDSGDMLARWTNDVIPATTHRVVNPLVDHQKSRYSIPFFMHPDPDVILSCLPSCIGDGARYSDIRAGSFLEQRLREIGLVNT